MDLRELLKIEEDGELLEYKVTKYNLPLWLFVRSDLIHFYLPQRLFGLENPHVKVSPFDLTLREKWSYVTKTMLKNPFRANKKDILIFGAGINNVFENKYYINRLYDYFWKAFNDKTLLLESSNKFTYPTPRFNKEVLYSDFIPVISKTLSTFIKLQEKDIKIIEKFLSKLKEQVYKVTNLDVSEYVNENKSRLLNLISKVGSRIFFYKKLLELVKPKLIIIEDAHYGAYTDLIYLSKQMNIKVAEYQHGFISAKHLSYNFHLSIHSDLKEYLPDYMLFWGQYWAEGTSIPGEKVIIGFPYIEEKSKNIIKEKIILVISGGNIPNDIVDFGLKLIKIPKLKHYKIFFRPHPSERPAIEERYSLLLENGYELDTGNLYESLKTAEICVGLEASTVLFEAIAYNCKAFLKLSDASSIFYEDHFPFNKFESIEQFLDMLDNSTIREDKNFIFAENPIENFRDFLIQSIYKNREVF